MRIGRKGLWSGVLAAGLAGPVLADYVAGLEATGDDFLALRSGPGTDFEMLGKMPPDTLLTVLEQHGSWRRVELQDGRWGWAHGRYIAPGQPPPPGGIGFGDIGRHARLLSFAPLRLHPAAGADALRWLDPQTRVLILSVKAGWVRVQTTDGAAGWVEPRLLQLEPAAGPSPDLLRRWATYVNPRYGTVLEYPSDYFLAEPDAPAGDGRRWYSVDGRAELVAYARYNFDNSTLAEILEFDKQTGGYDQITFAPLKDGWFIISGYVGPRIFYRRVQLSADREIIHTFEIRYPRADKTAFDPVVTRMSHAFAMN